MTLLKTRQHRYGFSRNKIKIDIIRYEIQKNNLKKRYIIKHEMKYLNYELQLIMKRHYKYER